MPQTHILEICYHKGAKIHKIPIYKNENTSNHRQYNKLFFTRSENMAQSQIQK